VGGGEPTRGSARAIERERRRRRGAPEVGKEGLGLGFRV
jgi:hypothetical protein